MNDLDEAKQALKKRATGYQATETVEEYSCEDGELKLLKKKVTTKHIPPEVSAVKVLLGKEEDVATLSDEELEAEKQRLLSELNNLET